MKKEQYIIVEIIPEAIHPKKGSIVQLSALKIENLKLQGRFDYRLEEEQVQVPDLLKIINYDQEEFTYKHTSEEILEDFRTWSEKIPLLILDNPYTRNFLETVSNKKNSIAEKFGMKYHDDLLMEIIKKYHLQPSNHVVDLLYEALIEESNLSK